MNNTTEEVSTRSTDGESKLGALKRIAKTHAILGLCKWGSILLILITFMLPLIKVNALLEEYNFSTFDIVLSQGDSESPKGIVAASVCADFLGVGDEYKSFLDIYVAVTRNASILPYLDTVDKIYVMVHGLFMPILSMFSIIFLSVAAVLGFVKILRRLLGIESVASKIDSQSYYYMLRGLEKRGGSRSFAYYRMKIKNVLPLVIGYGLGAYTFNILPTDFMAFAKASAYIELSVVWSILYFFSIIAFCVFTVAEYVYGERNSSVIGQFNFLRLRK